MCTVRGPPASRKFSSGEKYFFQTAFLFGSALQTLLEEFKFQTLLLSALTLTQILSLQQSYNLRVAHPHEKVLKADNILHFFPSPLLSNSISAPALGFGSILTLSLIPESYHPGPRLSVNQKLWSRWQGCQGRKLSPAHHLILKSLSSGALGFVSFWNLALKLSTLLRKDVTTHSPLASTF